MTVDRRRRELAKIHLVARRDMGMDEDTYRTMLHEVAGVASAGQLDQAGRTAVLEHLQRFGRRGSYPGRPHNADSPTAPRELRKIEALLADAGRPWSYADAMVKRMYGVDRLAWASAEQLRGILTALVKDAARHGRRTR